MAGTQRYWNGTEWTDRTAPVDIKTPTSSEALTTIGWICALLVPIAGFVIGCILAAQRQRHGVTLIVVSLISAAVWVRALMNGYLAS